MTYILKTKDVLMKETFNSVKKGEVLDSNSKPYEEHFLKEVLQFFENIEEYEKCEIINNYIKNRFNHNVGYKLK